MATRCFPREFAAAPLTETELGEIQSALTEAFQQKILAPDARMQDTEGGALYVGLGGVAAALFQLHLDGIPMLNHNGTNLSCLQLAATLCEAAMCPDLMPHRKVSGLERSC